PPPAANVSSTPCLGKIEDTSLRQVVLELVRGKRTGTLEVRIAGDIGAIHLSHGTVVHAEYRGLRGQDAFWKLLDIQQGTFGLGPARTVKERTVPVESEALLAEFERRHSEARALKKRLGSAR